MDYLTVIPAKAGIHNKKHGICKKTRFRVKPGMTNTAKEFATHYTRMGLE